MSNPFVGQSIRCAGPGCEHVRQSCNHWFVVWEEPSGEGSMMIFMTAPLVPPLDPADEVMKPVCGSACAQKLYDKWLSKKAPWITAGEKALESLAQQQK